MREKGQIWIMGAFALAASLLAVSLGTLLLSHYFGRRQYAFLNQFCVRLMEQDEGEEEWIFAALKECVEEERGGGTAADVLSQYGYGAGDFSWPSWPVSRPAVLAARGGLLAGILLFLFVLLCRDRAKRERIQELTEYLEQVNTGKAPVLSLHREDAFSPLEDAIYKTVTYLGQTKDAAVEAKAHFAENLANIAHQIKTPVTAISLSAQEMKAEELKTQAARADDVKTQTARADDVKTQEAGEEKPKVQVIRAEAIERQVMRLAHLEEALLLLSRLDAGTLVFQRKPVDVYTLLVLAADNLQDLFAQSGTSVHIPELGEMAVYVDLDWTMEAVMNLMKNGMEHNPGGIIRCTYQQNPLYTEILIWDEGEGFAGEDIPHLFERFYRGKNAAGGGIGIGLALAKEIIEGQNGTIRAANRPEGGACFAVRFYPGFG